MKKIGKIMIILTIILLVSWIIMPKSVVNAGDISDAVSNIEAEENIPVNKIKDIKTLIGKILGFLQIASALTTVIVIAFYGIQFIVETTPDVKGRIKEKGLPIITGIVFVFGAVSIAKFLIGVAE